MRQARRDDIPVLLALMCEFYAESGYELDRAVAERAFAAILSDDRLGYVWLIDDENKTVGYIVLTLRFAMEYGGLIGCLDDLFVVPQSRNKGLSTAALIQVRDFCKTGGIRAITVEVGFSNGPAQAVYRRVGLADAPDRQLLALALAPPAHVV
jgi:GNAT superfamily N-acetyltransferase